MIKIYLVLLLVVGVSAKQKVMEGAASGVSLGGECKNSRQCTDPHTVCSGRTKPKVCVCVPGHARKGSGCVPAPPATHDGEECHHKRDCGYREDCRNNECVCEPGYKEDASGRCDELEIYCKFPGNCRDTEDCTNNDCVCKDGYSRNFNDDCVPDVSCSSNSCGTNEWCKSGACVCRPGYTRDAGGPCVQDVQCDIPFDCGTSQDCCNTVCKCQPGFVRDASGNCVRNVDCFSAPECGSTKVCSNNVCKCRSDHVLNANNKCVPGVLECPRCDANEHCFNSHCVCNTGYTKVSGVCVRCPQWCGANSHPDNCQCECNAGCKRINGVCVPCPTSCGANEHVENCQCVCNTGCKRINGGCVQCPQWCGANAHPDNCQCECNAGCKRINGVCVPCPTSCGVNEYLDNCQCLCNTGYARVSGICVEDMPQCWPPCGTNEHCDYNMQCTCDDGYTRFNGDCVIDTGCTYGQWSKYFNLPDVTPCTSIRCRSSNPTNCPLKVEKATCIHCVVGDWLGWVKTSDSPCTETNTREIKTHPDKGGNACPALTKTKPCDGVNCQTGDWGPWLKYDGDDSCFWYRFRKVLIPASNGGTSGCCPILIDFMSCGCSYGKWSDWQRRAGTYCTAERTRVVESGSNCNDDLTQTIDCSDCVLGDWDMWDIINYDPCTEARSRVIHQHPTYGGHSCESLGELYEERPCGTDDVCDGMTSDVVFLLDVSGSVDDTEWLRLMEFIWDLISQFPIGANDVRVGLVTFDHEVVTEFHLNRYTSQLDVIDAINNVNNRDGSTHTSEALNHVRTVSFTSANGDRPDAQNILIILTDGLSSPGYHPGDEARQLKEDGVKIIAVGIGIGSSTEELEAMASQGHSYNVESYNLLDTILDLVETSTCGCDPLTICPGESSCEWGYLPAQGSECPRCTCAPDPCQADPCGSNAYCYRSDSDQCQMEVACPKTHYCLQGW